MAEELASIDITGTPDLLRLAREVRATRQPRVLRTGGEDVAVIMPLPTPAKRRSRRAQTAPEQGTSRFTVETAAGSVGPPTRTEDIEGMIQDAKEERAERLMSKLRRP